MDFVHSGAQPLALPNGVTLSNRIVMAPMVVWGSSLDGEVTEADIAFAELRSDVAGLLIAGSATVSPEGRTWDHQLSIVNDDMVPGLARLAEAMKSSGHKALIQLHHAGREAEVSGRDLGYTMAPSGIAFPWLPLRPTEMTNQDIARVVEDFGAATQRAIDAGFDGVEIHGANFYLLQQFLSVYANRRDDDWGGDLARRMAFPLAVTREVQRVVAEAERPDFIVGMRLIPEEWNKDVLGYPIEECLELVDALADQNIDYIHLSLSEGFAEGEHAGRGSFSQRIRERLAGRAPVIVVGDVFTADDVAAALAHADLVAIGRAALIEPEFAAKIANGHEADLHITMAGRLNDLAWPPGLLHHYTTEPMKSDMPPMPGLED